MIVPHAEGPRERMEKAMDALLPRLRRWRLLARSVLLFEGVWPAIWPALGVLGVFLCAALLDLRVLVPGWLHALVLAVLAVLFLTALGRGLRRLRLPDDAQADRRLESASGLRHRPLSVLADRPALPGAESVWAAHVARAMAQLGRLRVGLPHPGLARIDRRALRGLLLVSLAACLGIAGEQAPRRVLAALQPGFATAVPPPAAQVQAWITPPAYTGLAPVFLRSAVGASVPAASHLTISITGGAGEPAVRMAGNDIAPKALDGNSFQAEADLSASGALTVTRGGQPVASWDITVIPGERPVVLFPEPPGIARGRTPQTRLPWQVSHPYGVVGLQAELRLQERPDAPALVVPIPLPGGSPKEAHGVRLQDLTAHPWAGLPVVGKLVGRDAAGLTGTSADAIFELPERRFQHPVARALMAVRKMLSVKPDEREMAGRELDQLSAAEDSWKDDMPAFLNLRGIASLLKRDRSTGGVEEAQARMWQLALHLEEGAPERTAKALEQARQELREALEAEKRGEPVDKADLERKAQELKEALQRHLQALSDQARRDPDTKQFNPDAHPLDARDMRKLAEQMQKDAQEGRMDEARDKMAELEKLMEEMQNGRTERGKMTEQERKRAEKRQKGQQQMSTLQDLVRRQGGLLDHAQSRAEADQAAERQRFLPRRPTDSQSDPAQRNARNDAERATESRVQQALRRVLGELMQLQGDLTGDVPPNLSEADTAMREAGQALAQSRDPAAAGAQQRAIEALQKGGRSMNQQMAQQFGRPGQEPGDEEGEGEGEGEGDGQGDGQGDMAGGQDGGNQPGGDRMGPGGDRRGERGYGRGRSVDRRADDRRDPLGRPLKEGASGRDESGDVVVPDEMEQARTRAIQDELRRRAAERSRPQPELDYIDRLLRQF
jgi:uncharacterized protein (TIGR02302 family)